MRAFLGLATGDIFAGELVNEGDLSPGEILLYHSQKFRYEILTDPVHYNRIVVSDAVTIDNRWPHNTEIESYSPHLKALVVLGDFRNSPISDDYYNLINYFKTNGITLFIPDDKAGLKSLLNQTSPTGAIIASNRDNIDLYYLKRFSNNLPAFQEYGDYSPDEDPVRLLSTRLEFIWDLPDQENITSIDKNYMVVAYDYGINYSTLRNLKSLGCDIRVVPADYSPEQVIALKPEGILLSGGPGHPRKMGYAISNISRLIGLRPILATGLGHILLALSIGARIDIMRKPHFGEDIPVKLSRGSDQNISTSQSHLVSINRSSLEKDGFKVTLTNPEDDTVEGYENEDYLIQSYAFSLSRKDYFTRSCLQNFVGLMEAHRASKGYIS